MKLNNYNKKIKNEKTAIQYLINNKVISNKKKCYKCKKMMGVKIKEKLFVCQRKNCRHSESLFKKTFFGTCKFKIKKLLDLCYFYLHNMPVGMLCKLIGISSNTGTEWTSFLRQLLGESLEYSTMEIGGENIVVEIDETKMGKRKYHRGHRVDGVWVVCGVERTLEKKYFAVEVENRNSKTIEEILKKYVKAGSIVYTDMWRSYNSACENLNLEHYTVNHSTNFKDPITGVHTNTVEGFNNALKTLIKPRNRTKGVIRQYLMY